MRYPTHNTSGILVLNSDTNWNFFPGCVDQAQNWFWKSLKIKSPQQVNTGKLSRDAAVYIYIYVINKTDN